MNLKVVYLIFHDALFQFLMYVEHAQFPPSHFGPSLILTFWLLVFFIHGQCINKWIENELKDKWIGFGSRPPQSGSSHSLMHLIRLELYLIVGNPKTQRKNIKV